MRASVAVAFCLLLGLVLLQAVTAVVNPGKCPAAKDIPCSYKKEACDADKDCKGGKKCCDSRCGKQCQYPAGEKPGKCKQYFTLIACKEQQPPYDCNNDWQCKGSKKCCLAPCEFRCDDPEDKPGECPVPTTACAASKPLPANCTHDYDCPGKKKCCIPECTQQCTDPLPVEKPGQCPAEKDIPCNYKTQACNEDKDCTGSMKCCNSGCGKQCHYPADKPGECPIPRTRCDPSKAPPAKCAGDYGCPGEQKCCTPECTQECTDPKPVVKPGQCPPFLPHGAVAGFRCMTINTTLCKMDQDCEGRQKCCTKFCKNVCENPLDKPGECPIPRTRCDPSKALPANCTGDYDCPGEQKCCTPLCRQECTDPKPVVKPGQCPPFLPPGAVADFRCPPIDNSLCKMDQDCEGKQKCCRKFCENVCENPLDNGT